VITLALDAATYAGSAALLDGARVVAERTVAMRGREHEALMPAVAELLALGAGPPGRIVCGAGPGAFTSLRIAGGIAKGLALATGIPIVPVSSLALVVAAQPLPAGRYLAVIDAMRGQHYAQPFVIDAGMTISALGPVALLHAADLGSAAAGATVIGPGQAGEARIDPHARGVARITNMIDAADAADLASWEPAYGRLAEAQVKWEAEHGRRLFDAKPAPHDVSGRGAGVVP
jgi:tRNA threonylcarbamoyladenosine biosynthesis protein TsaB